MKLQAYLLLLFLFVPLVPSQTYLGNYTSYTAGGNSIEVFAGNSSLKFIFYKPDIVKVEYSPTLTTQFDSSFVVIRDTTESVAVTVNDFSDSLVISSPGMKIICGKFPLRVSFYTSSNKLLLSEPAEGGISSDGDNRIINFTLDAEDHFYGTGERGTALDKRGQVFLSYNSQIGGYTSALPTMNINIPFFVNPKGYAIYIEDTYPANFDFGNTNPGKITYTAFGGELSYFVIAADDIPQQLEKYTWLTGRQPLPPRWAFGYIQSKFGYENEGEARFTVQTLRLRGIPADAIVLDLYWYENMGDLTWDYSHWSDPFQMMRDFLDEGVKTIAITEPYIVEYSINFQPAITNNFFAFNSNGDPYLISNWWSCGCDAGLLDLTNPSARQWWWDMHPSFFGNELRGIWTDLGEPENHPEGMNHYLGSRNKVHNIYNLLWAETIFNGFNEFRPNQRLFNLTRSGYAGIQRYGVIPWSGDVGKSFGGLAVQLPMLLNMGMSGLGYHNSDIGGFCCGYTSPELYIRWMQYGTFSPVTRTHGVGQPTEPWGHGEQAERISKKFIKLRYKLLPYIYTTAFQNYLTGMPLARPLFFEHPEDAFLYNYSSSYMWGDNLLVSPVVTEGAQTKNVYLPAGKWINYWNNEIYEGGTSYNVDAPLDIMPLFVKDGSIIPMQPEMDYSDEFPLDTLILAIYPEQNLQAEFTLYEDDGTTLEYQSGSFAETHFTQFFSGETSLQIDIGASTGSFQGKLSERIYLSQLHRIGNAPTAMYKNGYQLPARISYEDLRINENGYFYDNQEKILYVQIKGSTDSSYSITGEGVVLNTDNNGKILPDDYVLEQNYPNPFNPSTIIKYSIPSVGTSLMKSVQLKVYDVLGNEIATLVDEFKEPGTYQVEFNASGLSSGIYFYRLQSGNFLKTKKMVLLR